MAVFVADACFHGFRFVHVVKNDFIRQRHAVLLIYLQTNQSGLRVPLRYSVTDVRQLCGAKNDRFLDLDQRPWLYATWVPAAYWNGPLFMARPLRLAVNACARHVGKTALTRLAELHCPHQRHCLAAGLIRINDVPSTGYLNGPAENWRRWCPI